MDAASPRPLKPHPRSWARRCAVQALYQWQLTGQTPDQIVSGFLADEEARKADQEYFRELVHEVAQRVTTLDTALLPLLDRPIAQVDPVERAILRLGAYELMYKPDTAYRIILNEAIELAKRFGADQSYRYVNNVLDQLARAVRPTERALSSRKPTITDV